MDYLANGIPNARHASLKHYKIIITRRNLRGTVPVAGSAQLKPAPRFTMGKKMIAEFESRILALIDDMVTMPVMMSCLPVGICVAT